MAEHRWFSEQQPPDFTTATLTLRALAIRSGVPVPVYAEGTGLLWDASGVVVEDLASRVLVLNLRAQG
jgi:hypothetical protein